MSSEAERQFLDKIIAYANLSGLSDQLYLARLVALGLKDTGDVFFEDRIKGEYFLSLVSYFKEAKDKKYFSIIAPVGSRSYYEQYIPDPLLESDNKKLTTRNKSLTTRNRNLSSENKNLREENQLLQTQVDRLSSGEEFKAQKELVEQLTFEKTNLMEALTNTLEDAKTANFEVATCRIEVNRLRREAESHRIEADRLRHEASDYQSQFNQASLDLVQRIRLGKIARNAFLLFLSVILTLGLLVSSRFSDLEESFNIQIADAENRIILAERRADDAEDRIKDLQNLIQEESEDTSTPSDPSYTIALYTLRAAEKQGNLKEYLQYLDSCGVDITAPPYGDFAYALEPDEPPANQDTTITRNESTTTTNSGTGGGRTPSTGTTSGSGNTTAVTGTTNPPDVDPPNTGDVVYITETGTKYHLGHCSHLAKSKIEIDRSKAIDNGYTPCSRCDP